MIFLKMGSIENAVRNAVINAATVEFQQLPELIAYKRIFYNARGLLLKIKGPSPPPHVTTLLSLVAIGSVEVWICSQFSRRPCGHVT